MLEFYNIAIIKIKSILLHSINKGGFISMIANVATLSDTDILLAEILIERKSK